MINLFRIIFFIALIILLICAAMLLVELNTAMEELRVAATLVEEQITYLDVIYQTAERYDISPELALAMMKVESNFNPSAVSSAGCVGLMQVSPIHTTANLLNLRDNVECSFSLISDLKSQSEDLHQMLGMYNRGVRGYWNYVARSGNTATAYSNKVIKIMEDLKGE